MSKQFINIKRLGIKTGIVLMVVLLSIWVATPLGEKINLGLDLKGGMHLVMKVEVDKALEERGLADARNREELKRQCIRQSIDTIRNRIDAYGVKEAGVQHLGGSDDDKILVTLPGVDKPEDIKALIKSTAMLAFKAVGGGPFASQEEALTFYKGDIPSDLQLYPQQISKGNLQYYSLKKESVVTGANLKNSSVGRDTFGRWEVHFELDNTGADLIRTFTAANIGKPMAVVFDGKIESIATIESVLSHDSRIRGNYTLEEVKGMVLKLQSGALAAPMTPVQERIVGPSLGSDSIKSGVAAALIGLLAVMIIMVIYYGSAGINAVLALILNILLLLAAMAYMGFTLTLPGIAGIILTIGMAVDANVLIFERIKEELDQHMNRRDAVEAGFEKAFATVLDANLTTIIASVMLLQMGSGPIKGFAVTLIIGIGASMFTALFVSRLIFQLAYSVKRNETKRGDLFGPVSRLKPFKGKGRFNVMNGRTKMITAALSIAFIITGMIAIGKMGFNQGVDFSGGVLMEVEFQKESGEGAVRSALTGIGVNNAVIQKIGGDGRHFLVKLGQDAAAPDANNIDSDSQETTVLKIKNALGQVGSFTLLNMERVGPMVGNVLKKRAVLAAVWALLGMLVYIGFRFKWSYGLAAVLTLIHDLLVCLSVLALFRIELSLPVAAALMTVIGYSLNDTIVIFDRVRDNLKLLDKPKGADTNKLLNDSIKQTLGRTLVTSATTLAAVVAFLALGGEALRTFSLTMIVGIVVGTYSSIFQSCTWLSVLWGNKIR